jgi:hypothetical protein
MALESALGKSNWLAYKALAQADGNRIAERLYWSALPARAKNRE